MPAGSVRRVIFFKKKRKKEKECKSAYSLLLPQLWEKRALLSICSHS
jgi:hypothetical protein